VLPGALGGGATLFSVWDYGGDHVSRHLHALNLLASPNSIYAIVIALGEPPQVGTPTARSNQRKQTFTQTTTTATIVMFTKDSSKNIVYYRIVQH
jgi:hypothetical protein